ncbi:hypothetical protein OH492_20385 [Vibrio chagasii]|nr:hypothetical protein [Vibrio chagasii]
MDGCSDLRQGREKMKKVAFVAPTYRYLAKLLSKTTEVESVMKACGHDVCVMTFKIESSENRSTTTLLKIGQDVRMGKNNPLVARICQSTVILSQDKTACPRSLFSGMGLS